jgi:hypothetical protein
MPASGRDILLNAALRCFAGPSPTMRDRSFARLVVWRYLDLYSIPAPEALKLISAGYHSPSHAMAEGQLKTKPMRTVCQEP